MGEIVKFPDIERPPSWTATVIIQPWPHGVIEAQLVAFGGEDGFEVVERCECYADALSALASQLRNTAKAIAGS